MKINLTLTEVTMGILALAGTILLVVAGLWLGLAVFTVLALIALTAAKEVAVDPPTVAILTRWGAQTNTVMEPRLVFAAEYFPFIEDLVAVNGGLVNVDLLYEKVGCAAEDMPLDDEGNPKLDAKPKSGGTVKFEISFTYRITGTGEDTQLTASAIRRFIKAGKETNIRTIAADFLGQEIREYASIRTWETVRASKSEIVELLTTELKGHMDKNLKNFGIEIVRLNVVNIEPEGELAKDQENLARETQQRRAEEMDIDTAVKLAKKLVDASGNKMTMAEALELVRIERGRAKETIFRGVNNNPFAAAGVLNQGGQ